MRAFVEFLTLILIPSAKQFQSQSTAKMLQRYIGRLVVQILVLVVFVFETRCAAPKRHDRITENDKFSVVQSNGEPGQFGVYPKHHPG